jgi:DNA-binding NarL/FixJ family response regulator
MTVRILIADDHAVVRDGLRMILGAQKNLSVVGTAANGREAVARAETLRPDVILMDIAMPDLNGIEATRIICQATTSAKVIILSMHHTGEHVFRALQAGARGYLLKESAGAEVVKAVRSVMQGHSYFGKGVENPPEGGLVESRMPQKSPLDSLSAREREVLQLVVEGKTSLEIAESLALSPKSVETYRSRLMKKLGVTNIPSLVMFAVQHGITPLH